MSKSHSIFAFFVAVLLTASSVSYADLVGYWTFNDNTLNDTSGNGYSNPALGGTKPTIVSGGKVDYALQGSGGGKYNYNVTAANVSSGNMTLAFWGNMNSLAAWSDYLGIYANGDIQFQRNANNAVNI